MKYNVLLTGAPGWLGSKLEQRLASKFKGNLRCLVLRGSDVGNFAKSTQVVRGDVREFYTIAEAMADVNIVIHAAGIIHAKPKTLMDINADGTYNMVMNALGSGKVSRFVYVSSNSAVGYTKQIGLMNEGSLRKPYMAYGKSKFIAEEWVNNARQISSMQTVILRPCWFYGTNQPERQTRMFKMIQKGKPIIVGDGRNLRSMTYVDNLVDAVMKAIDIKNTQLDGETFWIADKRPYTTLEIYETIADILGVTIKPRHLPAVVSKIAQYGDGLTQKLGLYLKYPHVIGEMTQNIACDVTKAMNILEFKPQESLREGMEASVKWCKTKALI